MAIARPKSVISAVNFAKDESTLAFEAFTSEMIDFTSEVIVSSCTAARPERKACVSEAITTVTSTPNTQLGMVIIGGS